MSVRSYNGWAGAQFKRARFEIVTRARYLCPDLTQLHVRPEGGEISVCDYTVM
jgi:hypothetical protein